MISPAARRLRELRKAKGWTQQQLADKAGVSRTTVRWVERGRLDLEGCHLRTIRKLCRALTVPMQDVVDAQT